VFRSHHGVVPIHNRAERARRYGVLWRTRSHGTASDKGHRWIERFLSLQETCRLRAVSTSHVLVEAVASFCIEQQPNLTWLHER
jgi:transposase